MQSLMRKCNIYTKIERVLILLIFTFSEVMRHETRPGEETANDQTGAANFMENLQNMKNYGRKWKS